MPEPKDNLNPEEIQQIESLLSALNKNPQTSEDLNPMARILREKLGYTEPFQQPQQEEESPDSFGDDSGSADGDDDVFGGGTTDDDSGPPPFRNLEADDDIDLDELLNEGETKRETPSGGDFDDFDTTPSTEPVLDDFDTTASDDPFADLGGDTTTEPSDSVPGFDDDFGTTPAATDEDPFADLGGGTTTDTPSFGEDDPFGGLDSPASEETLGDDPFGGLDLTPSQPDSSDNFDFGSTPTEEPSFGEDPFADLGGGTTTDTPSFGEDDPFGGLGGPSSGEPSGDDPFANLGGGDDIGGADPFADLGGGTTTEPSFGNDDPFGGLEAPATTGGDADFGDLGGGFDDPTPTSNTSTSDGFDDPFGDLGVGMDPPGLDDAPSFDDFAPSIDDMPISTMESSTDFGDGGGGFDDDLMSLGKEEEGPEEGLEDGLQDEDLAVIQSELVKYPPKLRRTIIDTIVNNRVPVRNQKELIELIKAQQKPEDIATFLGALLGERVELSDSSGKFSPDGVPIIASRDAYTKEGAIRRRELIRRTFISSAAAILLVVGLVSLYKYVIVPFRAEAQYALGLEKIEEYSYTTDALEKKKLLADAENYFIKGEEIFPHNLKYLNEYCLAYARAGQYDRAFEKCFGKVEPDFGYEPEDKEHKRAWENRKEVPNISFAKKTEWNDAGVETAGRKPLSELAFYLTSQDKVPRKVIKAGAYIASRLKYNVHDVQTYISLGKFHSFNRKDFIDVPPGSNRKKYKNDHLAIEYFKRVFTDANDPNNVDAIAGIAKIFYNKQEFGTAVKYYNDIIEKYPKNPIGHGGILSTYIEMWKRDNNPQFVLNHHRQVRNALNIEDELSLPILAKLASFYIDLDSEEVRIKYNINPEDQVTGMEIDDNVEYLLNIAYGKEGGSKFAEGYYQRARYYFKKEEAARALKQLELSSTYDVRHYLAVLLMAEYYIQVENYDEAVKLLRESDNRYELYKDRLGERDEDETLLEGRPGRISFDLGKIQLLESAGVNKTDNIREFPGRKVYPERSLGTLSFEEKERRNGLYSARESFEKALERGIANDPKILRECYYFLGWIDYTHGEFAQALDFWAELPEEDIYNNPTLLLGKGNSFYYTRQYNAALGNYLKLKDDYELKEQTLGRTDSENSDHREVFETLTALYNNIGAVYEKKQDTINALKYYWKAMETARKIGTVSEIATSNKDLVFARTRLDREPLLEDWLPPTLDKMKNIKK
ncbi:tetratricopeptide repeat protein [Leptospira idonii]|uniref:Tetratricopeptide repeat protein n=1 Tax=Leptospira idonii TaxID=1193500 RepID=A0A4R9M286_9LEPT|nr:tetratricopeptide repeat protein [Leptospira idonii]TGN18878.1 tetratricopeptide repeat protein [Leptospira idonii]